MEVNSNHPCHNCGNEISERATFCESCGQAKVESRLNIWKLFKDFISNIFNLDGRLFRSIKHMWRPAFLAKEYINGRRKSYVNPIRFFLLMLVILFFLLNNLLNSDSIEKGELRAMTTVEHKKIAKIYDTAVYSIIPDIDTVQHRLLREKLFDRAKYKSPYIFTGGTFLAWDLKSYEVTRYDAYSMELDSLFEKYQLTKWYDKLFIQQLIKVDKNRIGSVSYIINKLIWGVILYTFLVALFMKLVYIRNNFYYVEHLILVILYIAKVMLLTNLVLLIQLGAFEIPYWNYILFVIYFVIGTYFLFTLLRFYEQGFIKTFIKSSIISFASIYILIFSVTLVSLISLALF